MKTFRTLELAIQFHDLAQTTEISGPIKDQLNRAAASIALNLAEGNAKGSVRDKKRFFQMSYGSLRECQTIFRLTKFTDEKVLTIADQLGANLYKLLKSEIQEFK